jgi:hypothetical protein
VSTGFGTRQESSATSDNHKAAPAASDPRDLVKTARGSGNGFELAENDPAGVILVGAAVAPTMRTASYRRGRSKAWWSPGPGE